MKTQITELAALEGKAIAKAVESESSGATFLLFVDETFARFGGLYYADDAWAYEDPEDSDFVRLGLVTKEEIEQAQTTQRQRDEEMWLERNRQEYERLKALFEGGGK